MRKEIADFIMIHIAYIRPIQGIVENLERNLYDGPEDLAFLNKELAYNTKIAVKGLGLPVELPEVELTGDLDQANKEKFLNSFKILLGYFQGLVD